jgi:phage tail-like protein
MPDRKKDPYRVYNFFLEIDGITRAGFRECSGLDAAQDPIEYREGDDEMTPRKMPGLNKYSNISLKWGSSDDTDLWAWREELIASGARKDSSRKNGSIVVTDEEGTEVLRWNFKNGWATKWTGPGLNATGNEVAIETLEIAHEGLSKA